MEKGERGEGSRDRERESERDAVDAVLVVRAVGGPVSFVRLW